MAYKSFKEYLLANGLSDQLTKEEIKILKIQWRKEYQKAYHQKYGKKRIRKSITLNKQEENQLLKAANRHKIPLNEFMKQCIFGYLNQKYVVACPEQIHNLEVQIRKVGTLVNQIARVANRSKQVSEQLLQELYGRLDQIELAVEQALYTPPNLLVLIEEQLANQPSFEKELYELLEQHKSKLNDN